MQRAIDSAREMLGIPAAAAAAPSPQSLPTPTPSSTSSSSSSAHPPSFAETVVVHRASLVTDATIAISTVHHALALALHCGLLDLGLVCTGASDAGVPGTATAGFAPPHRDVPPTLLVPPGWVGPDGASFFFRYQFRAAGPVRGPAAAVPTVLVVALAAGRSLVVHAKRSGAGAGAVADVTLELDTTRFIHPSDPVTLGAQETAASRPLDGLRSLLRPLTTSEAGTAFAQTLAKGLFEPLLGAGKPGEREKAERDAAEAAAQRAESNRRGVGSAGVGGGGIPAGPGAGAGSGLFGVPAPLTGVRPGDFDRDLYPDFGAAAPGHLIGGGGGFLGRGGGGLEGGGNLVGPSHPLFQPNFGGPMPGLGGGYGGPLPPGVPPGARFDPFMPPGVMGGGAGRGRGGGRGGRGGRGGGGPAPFGPNPDHMPPPGFGGEDDGPPPEMYM
jgi:hypothetical protein